VLGYFAAGTTKRTSSILDMSGWEGVVFVAGLGTLLENGTLDVFVEQNTANQTSGMARLATTTAYTATAADALLSQSCIVVDVFRPQERYLQCIITPAAANAVILGIVAIKYKGRKAPVTAGATVLKSTTLTGAAEA
jgi:hypothetical protein